MDFKGTQFEKDIILWGVRWYVAYPISYRQLEEMRGERGVTVDHSTRNRWVIKYAPEVDSQRSVAHPEEDASSAGSAILRFGCIDHYK
jgi:transposase-like protein